MSRLGDDLGRWWGAEQSVEYSDIYKMSRFKPLDNGSEYSHVLSCLHSVISSRGEKAYRRTCHCFTANPQTGLQSGSECVLQTVPSFNFNTQIMIIVCCARRKVVKDMNSRCTESNDALADKDLTDLGIGWGMEHGQSAVTASHNE